MRVVWAGIKRTKGTAAVGKRPLLVETLKQIVEGLPDGVAGIRILPQME